VAAVDAYAGTPIPGVPITNFGGTGKCDIDYAVGCGVVFKLDKAGKETILHSFTGGTDGLFPVGLTQDARGNLYGTTEKGRRSQLRRLLAWLWRGVRAHPERMSAVKRTVRPAF